MSAHSVHSPTRLYDVSSRHLYSLYVITSCTCVGDVQIAGTPTVLVSALASVLVQEKLSPGPKLMSCR